MALAKTFCSAPWFQARIDWDGHYRPCCDLDEKNTKFNGQTRYSIADNSVDDWMRSEYLQYLKQKLANGIQLPECNSCWKKEKNKIQSVRQEINNIVINNQNDNLDQTWVRLFIDRSKDYSNYHLISADVKLSNTCNFSCAMCNPHDSSKIFDRWSSDLENPFVQEVLQKQPTYFKDILTNYQTKRGYQHLQDILAHPIKNLKVLGGEPLLDKDLLGVLQDQPTNKKSQIHLHIVTNGSQDLVSFADKLHDYKSISFGISLEGIGKMQDYARSGSQWPTIQQHILDAKNSGILISVHHTLQALTILDLPLLLKWCGYHQLPITFGIVKKPEHLAISVLPKPIRDQVIHNLCNIEDLDFLNSADVLLSAKNISELINDLPMYPENYKKFLDYITWFEKDSPHKLRDIQPLFYKTFSG
jgi:hypothetical protein